MKCKACGCILNENTLFEDGWGDLFCEGCYNETYTQCVKCGAEVEVDVEDIFDIGGEICCEDCYQKEMRYWW